MMSKVFTDTVSDQNNLGCFKAATPCFSDGGSGDPSSDWNAPSEAWGNYEEPTLAPIRTQERPLPEPIKVNQLTAAAVSAPRLSNMSITNWWFLWASFSTNTALYKHVQFFLGHASFVLQEEEDEKDKAETGADGVTKTKKKKKKKKKSAEEGGAGQVIVRGKIWAHVC